MKSIHFQITILILSFLFVNNSYSQLIINANQTPTQMADEIIGSGVTFSNPTFSGAPNSNGIFTTGGTSTNLGMASGIILSTGWASDALGPNNSGSLGQTNGTGSDPQLASLIPGYTINDACFLKFDFIPWGDTIKLRYVFGSEEYPEWVGSSFNDVFGFFITGINPDNGTYTNLNIALIPGTILPVTIDNVNNASHSQYYVDNTNGTTIQYDGFTTVLTAWCKVKPGTQYSIKIAVGDAGDSAYDSAIFLEKGSLSCDNNICVGDTINLISQQGPTGCSYYWTGPDGFTSTQQNPVIPDATVSMTGIYYSRIILPPDTSNAFSTSVLVNSAPTSSFIVSTDSICKNSPIQLIYTGTASNYAIYNWNLDGGTPSSITGHDPFYISWSDTGLVNISLTVSENGCLSPITHIPVSVKPIPTSSFTIVSPVCHDSISTISYTGNASANAIYTWNFDGGTIISGTGMGPYQVSWTAIGTHYVSLLVEEYNCQSLIIIASVVVTQYAGISSIVATNPVSIYPNPNIGIFTLDGNGTVFIYNILGECIAVKEIDCATTFSLKSHAKGIYMVKFVDRHNYSTMQKVVIQ